MPDVDTTRLRDEEGNRLVPASEISQIVETRVNQVNAEAARKLAESAERIARLEGTLVALQTKKTDPPVTLAELNQAVADGKLTTEEGTRIWAQQQRRETEALVRSTTAELLRNSQTQANIDRFKAAFPDLEVRGSKERNQVEAVILTKMSRFGLAQPTLEVELDALEQVYGPVAKLGKMNTDEQARETYREIGGEGGEEGSASQNYLKGATAAQREYYSAQVVKGNYTEAQVRAELDSPFNRHKKR